MAKVSDVTPQKRKGRFNIYIDGEFAFGVSAEVLVRFGLKPGMDIDKERIAAAVAEDDRRMALNKAFDILKYRARSERELFQALERRGFGEEAVCAAIGRLKELGYVDDAAFSKMIAAHAETRHLSKKELALKLYLKGVGKEQMDETLHALSEEQQIEAARQAAMKIYAKAKGTLKERRDRTAQALYRKGFEWDAIKSALSGVVDDENE